MSKITHITKAITDISNSTFPNLVGEKLHSIEKQKENFGVDVQLVRTEPGPPWPSSPSPN